MISSWRWWSNILIKIFNHTVTVVVIVVLLVVTLIHNKHSSLIHTCMNICTCIQTFLRYIDSQIHIFLRYVELCLHTYYSEQSSFGDSLMYVSTALFSSSLDRGENDFDVTTICTVSPVDLGSCWARNWVLEMSLCVCIRR